MANERRMVGVGHATDLAQGEERGWEGRWEGKREDDSLSLSEAPVLLAMTLPGATPAPTLPCEPDKDHLSPGANPGPSLVA